MVKTINDLCEIVYAVTVAMLRSVFSHLQTQTGERIVTRMLWVSKRCFMFKLL